MNGRKDDAGKARWDLVDYEWFSEIVAVLTAGAVKYADNNWRKVPKARARYIAALFRHVSAWIRGEESDAEDGLHHLAHAAANLMFLFWFDKHKKAPRGRG